ncbi:hypothetical protein Taro_011085, partial [Colocasia esculenta]|nr:hypothetical protein [Colocasia esculenta]
MEDARADEPLLIVSGGGHAGAAEGRRKAPAAAVFTREEGDIEPIRGVGDFWRQFAAESRKLWFLVGPAIFNSLCRYSLGGITQVVAGHVGTLELAAVSIVNNVISGFSFGIMMGMGSALETLCGQAYGAGQVDMLGVYMQRSWVILLSTALLLTPLYVFAAPLLRAIGQTAEISEAAGRFALWMLPQLFAFAANFPIAKFLQSQSLVLVMAAASGTALLLHAVLSWALVIKLGWGLPAAAFLLNASWWVIVLGQMAYVFSGACGRTWKGFTWRAFHHLWGFVRLSLASAIMVCFEIWYFTILILFSGYLKNAEVSVAALSICMNILGWTIMVAFGSNAATSVRVSNELGAGHPRAAKFSVVVVVFTTFLIGLTLSLILLITRKQYPDVFTNSKAVKKLVYELTPLLAASITINNVQPVLSGVAIGAGWQSTVAFVNFACYYVFGIPLGVILAYIVGMGVNGIWYGMLSGTIVQTLILFWITYRTNWSKEDAAEPLLVSGSDHGSGGEKKAPTGTVFTGEEGDIEPIGGVGDFWREFAAESRKLWYLAGPAIFTSVCQYSLGAVTQMVAGQVGTLELAAVSVENSIITGFSFDVMVCAVDAARDGALETLCGQVYGAGQLDMLGVYMQRSWVVVLVVALLLAPFYMFAAPLLQLIGQTPEISRAAGWFYNYPDAFTNSHEVKKLVHDLTPLLAASITINNVQPVLSGVAIGAGWQAIVAYVNIGSYYVVGIPIGLVMAYKMGIGVKGIWYGMLLGTVLQTLILSWMTYRTNWDKE